MDDPKLIITAAPLDLELCELLGEKPSDFVILLADGKSVPGYGTPYDSETARKNCQYICDHLNARGKESWWPDLVKNWGKELDKIRSATPEYRPVFSFQLHRVCVARSENLHCAIRLFEHLAGRVSSWGVGVAEGRCTVEIAMNGKLYAEEGSDTAMTICKAVARALREVGGGGAELAGDSTATTRNGAGSQNGGGAERQGEMTWATEAKDNAEAHVPPVSGATKPI